MEFDEIFRALLDQSKETQETRIMKLEHLIPAKYETGMDEFLEKFFGHDPFEIKPQDLETFVTNSGKIKKLKFDRRPTTFLSLFRFLELYRQQLKSIKSDLSILANCYKSLSETDIAGSWSLTSTDRNASTKTRSKKFEANDMLDPLNAGLKNQILANVLSAGKLLNKWTPQVEQLYHLTYTQINLTITESGATNVNGNGFVNLRKTHSEGYLNLTFKPYYENTVNFCIMCLAFSSNLKNHTVEFSTQTKAVFG